MTCKKNEQYVSLQVTDGLTVAILPNSNHEFLMTTKQVASGYGVNHSTINRHKLDHEEELIDGKHYLSTVSIPHSASPGSSKGTLWTKRGIIRLGFFIKSKQARMFRDWAEDLVLDKITQAKQPKQVTEGARSRRGHNRLTPQRMVSIMADVCRITDDEVRLSLVEKITGGQQL